MTTREFQKEISDMLYDPNWSPSETEVKLEEWQKLLLNAAEILEKAGWIQQQCYVPGEGYCMYGAMAAADLGEEVYQDCVRRGMETGLSQSFDLASEKLNDSTSVIFRRFWNWNDAKDRTKEEVVGKLREVAHAV